jgi:hypothetical protein
MGKEHLSNYTVQNTKNRLERLLNFESVLYTIQMLYSVSKDIQSRQYNHRLNPFIDIIDFPEVISFGKEKKAVAHDFHFLHSYLVDKLLAFLRGRCKTLPTDKKTELDLVQSFLNKLQVKFDLGIVNLNYDDVILTALPDLNTAFDKLTGKFSRKLLFETSWNFCYHLHGSVHFDMKGGDDHTEMHKICWNSDLSSLFQHNSSGRNNNDTTEGIDHLNSNIITGLDKANQGLREPFASYFMQLDRLVYEADAILFIGYGFADVHLNKIFPFVRYDKEKIRKIVVIDWAGPDEDGLNFRHDDWTYGLFTTIPYNASEMGNGVNRIPQPAIRFKKSNTLEKSANPDLPLAVWYNGLLSASTNVDKIIKELL